MDRAGFSGSYFTRMSPAALFSTLAWPALLLGALANPASAGPETDFHRHLGLEMWSLRADMPAHPGAGLDQVRAYGLTEVETAGTADLPAEKFAAMLHERGLTAIGGHFAYDRLQADLPGVIRDARVLGMQFVVCPILPPALRPLTEAEAREVAVTFNAWGQALHAAGLRFAYHTHGLEFSPLPGQPGRTVFDVLMRETNPAWVSFEMDVFWVYHGGQDPATLLARYPHRWSLLHLKDFRRGAGFGTEPWKASAEDNVAVGSGRIDWPGVLRQAELAGVEHYFIEDETPAPKVNIPRSLRYLQSLPSR